MVNYEEAFEERIDINLMDEWKEYACSEKFLDT